MEKTAIKNFAVWARVKLMEDIRTRLGLLGITEDGISDPLPASTNEVKYFDIGADHPVSIKGKAIRQREQLAEEIRKAGRESNYQSAYRNFIESSAYDWFNRLIAIRYMEVNEYAPLDVRLLSSVEPGKQDPDFVSTPFDGSLEYSESETQQILAWKEQHDNNKLFRFLLFKMCNRLHEVLPGIFEARDDASELLMRQSFIDKDGIIHHLVNDIPEEDWKDQVQIIGWIYQYYNFELKAQADADVKAGGKISKDNLPEKTQIFTPDWIVRYMVENSLGRLWLEGHPNNELRSQWNYFLDETEQEQEVKAQLTEIHKGYAALKPEDILCIDPCQGSGHILAYMFDVFVQIYESYGYTAREAVASIVKYNIWGLDIDDRASQLAYFSVMMKARQYDRRFFSRGIQPHIYSIIESNTLDPHCVDYFVDGRPELRSAIDTLLKELHDAKEYGSILNVTPVDFVAIYTRFEEIQKETAPSIYSYRAQEELLPFVRMAQTLTQKYNVVVTNPPYLGLRSIGAKTLTYIQDNYPNSKNDLFAVFIDKCINLTRRYGKTAMVTAESWLSLSSFEKIRGRILRETTIDNMIHLGEGAFDAGFGTVAFSLTHEFCSDFAGLYIKVNDFETSEEKQNVVLTRKREYCYVAKQKDFSYIPGDAVSYWVSQKLFDTFVKYTPLGDIAEPRQGLTTCDNDRFMRFWYEVPFDNIAFHCKSTEESSHLSQRWYPYNKGGEPRKWYGNNEYVVNWQNDGAEVKAFVASKYVSYTRTVKNIPYYFRKGLTWSAIAKKYAVRAYDQGFIFADKGQAVFASDDQYYYLCGLMNSKYTDSILAIISPTLDFNCGYIKKIPIKFDDGLRDRVTAIVKDNIAISKADWDSYETSWDFKIHPMLPVYADEPDYAYLTRSFYESWASRCEDRFNKLKVNEEELNRIFIGIYGLQEELSPEVEAKDITVRKADLGRDIRSLISYAIGCMFGRYSLDKEGLIYAGGDWKSVQDVYKTFLPDQDNVIPITDQKYLDDDVVERICEFLTVVYGAETLEENLDFIAKALGNKGLTSREVIRNYMLNDFFKDHCKTYSVTGSGKRPIYWLFDSGKENAFKALVYMHRWDADTTGRVLLYAQQIQQKYETEIRAIDMMLDHITDAKQKSTEEKRQEHLKKQLEELVDYEERLEHMANERIAIDLDDGVKVNYEKVQTDRNGKKYQILAPIK